MKKRPGKEEKGLTYKVAGHMLIIAMKKIVLAMVFQPSSHFSRTAEGESWGVCKPFPAMTTREGGKSEQHCDKRPTKGNSLRPQRGQQPMARH